MSQNKFSFIVFNACYQLFSVFPHGRADLSFWPLSLELVSKDNSKLKCSIIITSSEINLFLVQYFHFSLFFFFFFWTPGFMRKVFGIVLAQLLATTAFCTIFVLSESLQGFVQQKWVEIVKICLNYLMVIKVCLLLKMKSVLLYEAETWKSTACVMKKLWFFIKGLLRKILVRHCQKWRIVPNKTRNSRKIEIELEW